MDEAAFRDYFALFNARRYDEFTRYYAEDVVYVMDANNGKIFHGPQAIADLYRELHQYFEEKVEIANIAITDKIVAVEVPTTLRALKAFDLPGFVPIPEGKTCRMVCFNHYDLNADGKFSRIRVGFHSIEYID